VSESGSLELRASDAEREATAQELGRSQAEGRLTLDELSQRLDLVYAARTRDELTAVTRDLPAPTAAPAKRTGWIVSLLGGSSRTGRWRPAARLRIVSIVGGSHLDLSRAVVTTPEVWITAFAFLGGAAIEVPRGVEVELTGFSLVGGRAVDVSDDPIRPGTPVIRVRAFTLFGGIAITNPPKRRT
jgi:hypothetical protein